MVTVLLSQFICYYALIHVSAKVAWTTHMKGALIPPKHCHQI